MVAKPMQRILKLQRLEYDERSSLGQGQTRLLARTGRKAAQNTL